MRHLQVRLEDDEYSDFKARADRANQSQQEAGKEAILRWARPAEASEGEVFGALTKAEETFLRGMLAYYRQPRDGEHAEWLLIIERLAKRALATQARGTT